MGAPWGPDSVDIHVSVSASGSVGNLCDAAFWAGSGSIGESSSSVESPEGDKGGGGNLTYYAFVNGAASSSPEAVEQYIFGGPDGTSYGGGISGGDSADNSGWGHAHGNASYSVSLDEVASMGTGGSSPDITLSADAFGNAVGNITVWGDGAGNYGDAVANADASGEASVSLSLSQH